MLTDEQLAERLRAALARETATLEPPPGLLEAVHAELAVSPPARPWRGWRPGLAVAVAVAVTVAVAGVVLAGHRAPSPNRGAASQPALRHGTPAPAPSAGPVTAAVTLTFGPVAHYCDATSGNLVACPAGGHPLTPQPQRLVTLTLVARRPTDSRHWYAWSFTAPPGCRNASDGGPTRSAVRAGTRLTFRALLPAGCRGTARAAVVFVTSAGRSGGEQIAQVGQTVATVP